MITIHNAIYALNPLIVTIRGEIAYDKDDNVVEYGLAQARAKLAELETAEATAEAAKQATHASALAKLKTLGLTDDEISALKGTL
jgi:hypothetical protein